MHHGGRGSDRCAFLDLADPSGGVDCGANGGHVLGRGDHRPLAGMLSRALLSCDGVESGKHNSGGLAGPGWGLRVGH